MTADELREKVMRLQEINVALATLYAERGGIQSTLFKDPQVGPMLTQGGEVSTPDGYTVKGDLKDPDDCSEYERKNNMKAPDGRIVKLKLSIPKGQKP